MAAQKLVIGGTDFTAYVKELKWSRNDIDAPSAGRDMKGRMRRKRVAVKAKLQVACRPMRHSQLMALNAALDHETVKVDYLDPRKGSRTGAEFYGSTVEAAVWESAGGDVVWSGVSFNIVEV